MRALFASGMNLVSDCSNPVLDAWIQVKGIVKDPFAMDFQVWKLSDLTQAYPVIAGDWQAVTVDDDCPAGHKLGAGHFVIAYDPGATPAAGLYEVRIRYQVLEDDAFIYYAYEFEILASPVPLPRRLAFVQDMRDQGVAVAITDRACMSALQEATLLFEHYTRRRFGTFYKEVFFDGKDKGVLLFDEPIIGVEEIEIISDYVTASGTFDVDLEEAAIYNRHLTQNLLDPDDRDSPKFSLRPWQEPYWRINRRVFGHEVFPTGKQNIRVKGLWGYTEGNGSPTGDVPFLVRKTIVRLAISKLGTITSESGMQAPIGPIVEEKTRDQSTKYAKPATSRADTAIFTGDPEVDNMILAFAAPPEMGSA